MLAPNEQRRHRDTRHEVGFIKRHDTPENAPHPLPHCIVFFRTADVATNELWDRQFATDASDNVPNQNPYGWSIQTGCAVQDQPL